MYQAPNQISTTTVPHQITSSYSAARTCRRPKEHPEISHLLYTMRTAAVVLVIVLPTITLVLIIAFISTLLVSKSARKAKLSTVNDEGTGSSAATDPNLSGGKGGGGNGGGRDGRRGCCCCC
ncbi:hypothetical protein DPSP01_007690 [Paraphaeosphaeria sporulosa]